MPMWVCRKNKLHLNNLKSGRGTLQVPTRISAKPFSRKATKETLILNHTSTRITARSTRKKQLKMKKTKGMRPSKAKTFNRPSGIILKALNLIAVCLSLMETEPWFIWNSNVNIWISIEFQKALDDCNSALALNKTYVKAYHRKAKALQGLSKD